MFIRLDGDVLLPAEALEAGLGTGTSSLIVAKCDGKPDTPEAVLDGNRVRSIELRNRYAGPNEWICAEVYRGFEFQRVVFGATDLLRCGMYLDAINAALRSGALRELRIVRARWAHEIDSPADLEKARGGFITPNRREAERSGRGQGSRAKGPEATLKWVVEDLSRG